MLRGGNVSEFLRSVFILKRHSAKMPTGPACSKMSDVMTLTQKKRKLITTSREFGYSDGSVVQTADSQFIVRCCPPVDTWAYVVSPAPWTWNKNTQSPWIRHSVDRRRFTRLYNPTEAKLLIHKQDGLGLKPHPLLRDGEILKNSM